MVRKETAMPDFNKSEWHPGDGAEPSVEKPLHDSEVAEAPGVEPRPREVFKSFDDPAFSAAPAQPPVDATAPSSEKPPKDTHYSGHPDFSQDAAGNKPPRGGIGLTRPVDETSEETRQSGSRGPSVAHPGEEGSKVEVEHRPL
jgi:hypothetical protein